MRPPPCSRPARGLPPQPRIGPFVSPLPQTLAIGALILSVPWWAHRRRRAKVRVERKLQAWPDIAKAIGLAGSQVMSATVDVWGWRARFRLARGQTITDVVAKIPAIESGLGTFRGAVRVYPTPDDLANRCEIRVLDVDPHAGSIPWPGPSVTSITQPIDLGPFEDASPCHVLFMRRHGLFGGATGSGKSGGLNVLMGNLVACRDVVIWAIDLKKGMELKPWESCIARLATTPEQAIALLRDAVAILEARAELLAATGRRAWEISPDMPALVIIIDEYAELADEAPDAMSDTDSIARLGRAVAVTLIAATQRPTQKAMGQGAVRSQMDLRICFRVRERKDVDLVLGQGMLRAGWDAHNLNAPGKFLVSAPEHDTPKRARAYLLTDQVVTDTAARYAGNRPALDEESQRAILAASNPRPIREGNSAGDSGSPDAPIGTCRIHDGRRRAVARAVHGPRRRSRNRRPDARNRHDKADHLPAPSRARQSGPRRPGQPWTLARAHHRGAVTVSDRLTDCLVSPLARASARKRAYTADETNDETSTERRPALTG